MARQLTEPTFGVPSADVLASIEAETTVQALREANFKYEAKRRDLEDKFGARIGLHTHLNLYVPGVPPDDRPDLQKIYRPDVAPDYRGEFRAWARGWPERQVGRRTPRAIRVRGPKKETPWLHWLTTSYLMKGYDRSAVVQSARNSPDRLEVLLGDLIAWPCRIPALWR